MSAAARAMSRPDNSAYRPDDGDNGHIGDDAFDDGLPSFFEPTDGEDLRVSAPRVVAYLRSSKTAAPPGYKVDDDVAVAYELEELNTEDETALSPQRNGETLVAMQLCGCEARGKPEDAGAMQSAKLDLFFVQPVLDSTECKMLVDEMDAVAQQMGWQDDGTGVKFQATLSGHVGLGEEIFTQRARETLTAALEKRMLPLMRRLFGCPALSVRGNSAALIRYGSTARVGHGLQGPAQQQQVQQVHKQQQATGCLQQPQVFATGPSATAPAASCGFGRGAQTPRLEVHRDGATGVTINILLSQADAFTEGGTYFEGRSGTEGIVVRPATGHGLIHHRAMRHAAYPIHLGVRHVLVAFLESGEYT